MEKERKAAEKERKAAKRSLRVQEREREDTPSLTGPSTLGPSTGPAKLLRGKVGEPNIPTLAPPEPLATVQFHSSPIPMPRTEAGLKSPSSERNALGDRSAQAPFFNSNSVSSASLWQDHQGRKLKLRIRPRVDG